MDRRKLATNQKGRTMNATNLPYIERIPDPDEPGRQLAEICIEIIDRRVHIHTGIEEEHTTMSLHQARRYYDGLLRATEAAAHYRDDLDAVAST